MIVVVADSRPKTPPRTNTPSNIAAPSIATTTSLIAVARLIIRIRDAFMTRAAQTADARRTDAPGSRAGRGWATPAPVGDARAGTDHEQAARDAEHDRRPLEGASVLGD